MTKCCIFGKVANDYDRARKAQSDAGNLLSKLRYAVIPMLGSVVAPIEDSGGPSSRPSREESP